MYRDFLKRAQANIGRPEAVAWLNTRGITEEDARRFDLGYMDPEKDADLVAVLNGIYHQQGVEELRRLDTPYIIVPYEDGGYWEGIPTRSKGLAASTLKPKTGGEIWGRSSLTASGGEPVLVTASITDALLFTILGAWAVKVDGKTYGRLADAIRARGPGGPIVIVPPTSDAGDVGTAKELESMLGALGVPVSCYDYSNHEGEYEGAAKLIQDEKGQWRDALRELLRDVTSWALEDMRGAQALYLQGTTGAYMGDFKTLIGKRTGREAVPTGFEKLDKLLDGGMYPGLYILGAVSSLGKTTFVLQVADYVAASGRDVLFFSLEQSKEELMAKSLARITSTVQVIDACPGAQALTSRQILYKMADWIGTPKLAAFEEAAAEYSHQVGPYMFIVEEDIRPSYKKNDAGDMEPVMDEKGNLVKTVERVGLDTIRDRLQEHIRILGRGRAPVVFIDYLQILRPDDPTGRKSDKQNMDETVSELRRLSKTYQVPIFAISSLSRAFYNQAPTMAAFKESGAIEYSSDVLIMLAPRNLNVGEGDKDKKGNAEAYKAMREGTDRKLEALILKNRMGPLGSVPMAFNVLSGTYSEDLAGVAGEAPEDEDIPDLKDYRRNP